MAKFLPPLAKEKWGNFGKLATGKSPLTPIFQGELEKNRWVRNVSDP